MNTPTNHLDSEDFDGRDLPCETKRPAFLSRCIELPEGRSFIFVNGHDPVPLRAHLDRAYPGCFGWNLLEQTEPDMIRLQVTKLASPAGGFAAGDQAVSCS